MFNTNTQNAKSQYYQFKYVTIPDEPSDLAVALSDKTAKGLERPWRRYKMANEYLAIAYDDIDSKKADRLRACGKTLVFDIDANGNKHLSFAESCRVRLCPLCSWRRSLKCFYNTMSIINYIRDNDLKYSYVFVTLTIKNCNADNLSNTIDLLYAALKRFMQRKEIKRAFRGSVRNLEVTHNVNRDSSSFDSYHPHFHCIFAVKPSYFTDSKIYLSRAKISEIWQDCLQVDYKVQVDVRACYDNTAHAVAEASKYAAKASDYLLLDDWDLTVDTVRTLDRALANRRLVNYSGIFRDIKAKLNLSDVEDADLIHVNNDVAESDITTTREYYFWYSGYNQYYKV